MRKITTPQAILIGATVIALAVLFRADEGFLSFEAKAEVAGMDYYDLRNDYDFKNAVESVVENCDVNGYVDDDYLYSSEISC